MLDGAEYGDDVLMKRVILGQIFFISWFTNPPTVIFSKVIKK